MKYNINTKIFKAYDVRGVYPDELNEDMAFLIGIAFAKKTKAKEVVIGRDMRLGGLKLKRALIQGLSVGGVKKIIDIGLVPIDAIYFSIGILKYESGIMITASHNPKEYNGLKMIGPKMKVIRGKDLLTIIRKIKGEKVGKTRVRIIKKNIFPQYIKHVLSFVNLTKIRKFKVVIDAGNGMAGKVIPMLKKYLPINIIPLFFKLDGNFPNHPSNPLEAKSQVAIAKKIKQTKADFGVIIDGDTDRLFFVDEKGKFIRADITLLLIAKIMLKKEKGATVVYNAICSKMVAEKIKEWGGKPIRTKVGFVNVAEGLRKNKGIMGGELSAHYSFRDNAYSDSGFIALLIMLELLSELNQPLSKIVAPYYVYYKSPEINTPVNNIEDKLKEIKIKYKKYKQDYLDGVTIDNWQAKNGWWFNIRPSNTEPLLRLTIETKNKKKISELKKSLINLINK